ncbi:hypothetical protein PLICRDRAFT_46129 [Plicaturopsis crispa FD-325 SS-3]|uniref:DUF6987 domain-containing protein n=1 Tax=Plicaturopsis crispa FD-325 SS-3 TaxID=944288 RepID=A0A0C9SKT0_PLICR|nr:hypothetical protein PLICRDRAFT_46129 [Plicaturopsis crispa FD-325 SS-3]
MSEVDQQQQPSLEQLEQENPEEAQKVKEQAELADRLSHLIDTALERLDPMLKMIRKHIETEDAKNEDDRDEEGLVNSVRPLLEEATKVLNETQGAIKGADPDGKIAEQAKRNQHDHKATPEEQRLAESLKKLTEEVVGTIDWAKDKLQGMPHANKDLGPLFDAFSQPLFQIISGIGLLLNGVLELLGNLLDGIGLGGLLRGVLSAVGLDKILKGVGLGKWISKGDKK